MLVLAYSCGDPGKSHKSKSNSCVDISGEYSISINWLADDKLYLGKKVTVYSVENLKNYFPLYKGATQYANRIEIIQDDDSIRVSAFVNKTELATRDFKFGENGWSCNTKYIAYLKNNGFDSILVKFKRGDNNSLIAGKKMSSYWAVSKSQFQE